MFSVISLLKGEEEQPCKFHSIAKSNNVEKHAGVCVAVDAVDSCHGRPNTLFRRADDNWDDAILLGHSSSRSLCCNTLLVVWQQSGWRSGLRQMSYIVDSGRISCSALNIPVNSYLFSWRSGQNEAWPFRPVHFRCNSALLWCAGVTTGQIYNCVILRLNIMF